HLAKIHNNSAVGIIAPKDEVSALQAMSVDRRLHQPASSGQGRAGALLAGGRAEELRNNAWFRFAPLNSSCTRLGVPPAWFTGEDVGCDSRERGAKSLFLWLGYGVGKKRPRRSRYPSAISTLHHPGFRPTLRQRGRQQDLGNVGAGVLQVGL